MKKITYHILFYTILSLIFLSCSDESAIINQEAKGYMRLTVVVPGVETIPVSKSAISLVQENRIDEIDVLVFNASNVLLYKKEGLNITNASDAINENKKNFIADLLPTEDGGKVTLMVLANCRELLESVNPGDSKEQIAQTLNFTLSGKWPIGDDTAFKPFPMWAESIPVEINPAISIPMFTLIRSLAKVDVGLNFMQDSDTPMGLSNFKLKHVYVLKASNKGSVIPNVSNYNASLPSMPEAVADLDLLAYDVNEENNALLRQIYLAESQKGTTSLIIGGSYNGENETFYKISFVKNADDPYTRAIQPILRNYRYKLNITDVNGNGYPTIDQAISSEYSVNIKFFISIAINDLDILVGNGNTYLGVNEDNIRLDFIESQGSIRIDTNDKNGWKASIDETLYPWLRLTSATSGIGIKTLTFQASMLEPTDRISSRVGKIVLTAGLLKKEILVTQSLDLGPNSFIVMPGTMFFIPIKKPYYVWGWGDLNQPISDTEEISVELLWQDTPYLIEDYGILYDYPYLLSSIRFVTNINKEGNAVIAIKIGGIIRWSWHIWVTQYNPDDIYMDGTGDGKYPAVNGDIYKYNTGTVENIFMDRNLGALSTYPGDMSSYGLLYQWGRKDPFPGTKSADVASNSYNSKPIYNYYGNILHEGTPKGGNGINSVKITDIQNLPNTIMNPMIFYCSESAVNPTGDWYSISSTVKNDYLWSDVGGNKGIYDPCPQGWRVPKSGTGALSPWYMLTYDEFLPGTGPDFSKLGYYPAEGYRTQWGGNLLGNGVSCYQWTSSPARNDGYAMWAVSTFMNSTNTYNRGLGGSVRCVKE